MANDDSASNRYGFLKPAHQPAHRSTLSRPGVSSEFVHSKILDRVEKLIASIEQTVKNTILKPDTPAAPGRTSGSESIGSESIGSESIKEQLQSIKTDSPDYKQEGIMVLRECVSLVDGQLNNINHKLNP
ncbi:hypothetical protein [Legionella maioricensis]|uniref:Uncharacterized protein n=1 Tax=Legionella maioricensis TaxID=2896528 RepID=A0A9X2CYM2_9GAMM|nr:hypothetical protein [Legionella maioricensis]MCL9683304.1 hypothetical protein [Legionella maioricensis]MCL9686000.1 hypothetical protein [Legionella maioricensis]